MFQGRLRRIDIRTLRMTEPTTAAVKAERAPRGPAEVQAALIAACDRLCGERMPSSVTVRDVAAEAHVTTGLVHHYFESKEALLFATVRSASDEIRAEALATYQATGDPGAAIAAWWRFLERRPAYRTIIVWWLADGRDVEEIVGPTTFTETLAQWLAIRDPQSARLRAGLIGTLVMSGFMAAGAQRAAGLDPSDTAIARELEWLSIEIARGAPLGRSELEQHS